MIKYLFAPFAIANRLESLLFNSYCVARYHPNEALTLTGEAFKNTDSSMYIAAPTWQQVIDWFRESHQIELVVTESEEEGIFEWTMKSPEFTKEEEFESTADYYPCLINGIENALSYLESKQGEEK